MPQSVTVALTYKKKKKINVAVSDCGIDLQKKKKAMLQSMIDEYETHITNNPFLYTYLRH